MKSYEIWLVPNGRRDDFRRGMTGAGWPDACQLWGKFDTVEECRERFRELAEENFSDQMDERTRSAIWCAAEAAAMECGEFNEDQAREIGEASADKACEIYVAQFATAESPDDWSPIEWRNDLRWVYARTVEED